MRLNVYFARCRTTGLIKIGITKYEPRVRCGNIKGRPVLLASVAVNDFATERRFHARFAEEREHGEWFRPSDRLMATVREIAGGKFDLSSLSALSSHPSHLAVGG